MPTLWLDTSVTHKPGKLSELNKRALAKGVQVIIHTHAHLERCRQIREVLASKGKDFSQQVIDDAFLQLKAISIGEMLLDRKKAESWAEVVHTRYPARRLWRQAKLATLRGKLVDPDDVATGKIPMTADWLIALEVELSAKSDPEVKVAVDDNGEEWRLMRADRRAVTSDEAIAWIDSLPDAQ